MVSHAKTGLGIADLLADKRDAILCLARARKAHNVRVFGSVARSEATDASDIDFLVTFAPDYTLWDHVGLRQDLAALLGREVDVSTDAMLRDYMRERVLNEAVPL
ncbi:MAG: nucleotidyltransferase family protein [Anaerolineae bacterium]|nr:nucleotidyltransferase family protein [Anaerolineae bacterium]